MREAMDRVAAGEEYDPADDKHAHVAAQLAAARRVAELVGSGAQAAGVELSELPYWDLNRYIQITAQALSVLFRAKREG